MTIRRKFRKGKLNGWNLLFFLFLLFPLLLTGCSESQQTGNSESGPEIILWAWERPENLKFIDPQKTGVAFLAQTLKLQGEEVIFQPRRQPLEIPPQTYLIAVTRMETEQIHSERPVFSETQKKKVVNLILKTLQLPDVRAIQIDFDVVVSERDFYRNLLVDLKKELPAKFPLSITSLASWCVGDIWFSNLPVDEAVPMIFRMGKDDKKIRDYLKSGNDWNDPLCRKSYGIALDEPLKMVFKNNRRLFYFKNSPWKKKDLLILNR